MITFSRFFSPDNLQSTLQLKHYVDRSDSSTTNVYIRPQLQLILRWKLLESRGVFRTSSNDYNEPFHENSSCLKSVNIFAKKAPCLFLNNILNTPQNILSCSENCYSGIFEETLESNLKRRLLFSKIEMTINTSFWFIKKCHWFIKNEIFTFTFISNLQVWAVTPYVNLQKIFFSAGVSIALFSVLRIYGNILFIEVVLN